MLSTSRISIIRKSLRRMAMIAVAVVSVSSAQVTRAYIPASRADVQQTGITQDLVFVLTKGGRFQNVTSSLYTYQGQTYCVSDGDTLCIALDYDAGTVRDSDGNLIGYTVEDTNPQ